MLFLALCFICFSGSFALLKVSPFVCLALLVEPCYARLTATEVLKWLPCLGRGRKTFPLDQPLLFTVAFVVLCHVLSDNVINVVGITQTRMVCNMLWSAAGVALVFFPIRP